jgi:hypothetical protein
MKAAEAKRKRLERKANARKAQVQRLLKEKALLEAQIQDFQLRSRTPSPDPKPYISQAELIEILHRGSDTAAEDRHHCAHSGRAFKMAVQDRAAWLMRSEKMNTWLTSRYTEVRLVHGNYELAKISPVSYLCAMLVETLEQLEPSRVIHFFCGSHTTSRDPLGNAHGMVKSLLVQLLSQDTFNTSFLRPNDVQKIQTGELESLCDLFCRLVEQLDSTVALFCIVDGINYFATGQRFKTMQIVLDRLLDLAGGNSMNAVFKLLVTSPTTTGCEIRTMFSDEEIILVPKHVPRSGLGFADKQMSARTGTALKLRGRYRAVKNKEDEEEDGEDGEEDEGEDEGEDEIDVVRGPRCKGAISDDDLESNEESEGEVVGSDEDLR